MDRDFQHLKHFNSRNKREMMAPRPTPMQWLSTYEDVPAPRVETGPQINGANWLHVGSNVSMSTKNIQNQKKNAFTIMKDSLM